MDVLITVKLMNRFGIVIISQLSIAIC